MFAAVRLWIVISVFFSAAGWILTALHQLNPLGYLVLLCAAFLVGFWWRRSQPVFPRLFPPLFWHKTKRRFRRAAPRLFLLILALSFLSGAIYPGLNMDANAYRLPRIFHWLEAGRLYFYPNADIRQNISANGQEWLATPLIAFTHSDRLVFLINWISYLLLPGLIYSVFIRLHIRRRVAWWWMWFFSAGWCFVFQASSVANDSYAAIYALAAVDLALRARETASVSCLWLSALAAALLTNVKQTNLPLALLWLIAAWPARHLLRPHLAKSVLVAALAILVSVIPLSLLNRYYYQSFLPVDKMDFGSGRNFRLDPFWGVIGNVFCVAVQNLNPPFAELLPPYYLQNNDVWNRHMTDFVQGTAFGAHFASFEGFAILTPIYYSGGVSECDASMGLGFCVLLAATAVLGLKRKSAIPAASSSLGRRVLTPLLMAPWVVLVVFLAKVGASENARHLAPYYPFLLLLPFSGRVAAAAARSRLWQKTGLLTMAFAAFLVVTQAPRPLFPAQTWFGRLQQAYPRNWFIYGECFIYNLNGPRNLAAQRQWIASHIPPEEKTIGYVPVPFGCDEPALWLAYPGINVQSLTLRESPESLARQGVHYAFLAHDGFWARRAIPFDDFFTHYHATVVASANIAFDNASNCPSNIRTNLPRIFYVVRFDPATNSTATTARIPGQTD